MAGILKDWFILLSTNVLQHGFTAITYLYLARVFKPEQYGRFSVLLTAVSIAQLIASLGMHRIVTRDISAKPESVKKIVSQYRFYLSLGIVVTVIFLIAYLYYFETFTELTLLLVISLLFLLNTCWNYFESLAFGFSRFKTVGLVGVAFAMLIFFTVFILIKESYQLTTVILIMSIAGLIKLMVMQFFTSGMLLSITEKQSDTFDQDLLKSSLPVYGTVLMSLPIIQMPVLFLSQFSGKAEVGYFAAISKFTVPITVIIQNLNTILLPKLALKYRSDKEGFLLLTRNLFLIIALGGIVISFVSGLFSLEIILIFLSDTYIHAAGPLVLQFWIALTMMFHSFIGTVFVAAEKERLMVKLSLFNAVVIGSLIVLGSFFGALGLSQAMWIGYIIGFLVHMYFLLSRVGSFISLRLLAVIILLFVGGTACNYVLFNLSLTYKLMSSLLLIAIFMLGYKFLVPQHKQKELKEIFVMVRNG